MVLPMKVTRDTPDQLIISNSPWLIGLMLIIFILIFVAVGLLLITEDFWVGLLFAGFGGGIGFGAFVAFVRRVQLILDRPTLVLTGGMSTGTHPILNAYTNGTGPHRMVAAINTWLKTGPS